MSLKEMEVNSLQKQNVTLNYEYKLLKIAQKHFKENVSKNIAWKMYLQKQIHLIYKIIIYNKYQFNPYFNNLSMLYINTFSQQPNLK